MVRKTKFKKKFRSDAYKIFRFIFNDSPQNAEKFRQEVEKKIKKIENHPTANPPEPNLSTQRNWYRFSLVMKKWKIMFKMTKEYLVFLGIIHTGQNPEEIKKLRTNDYNE